MGLKKFFKFCLSSTRTGPESSEREKIIDEFHRLYYDSGADTWQSTLWLGTPVQKCPFDLWIYQEIIAQERPEAIIETGTLFGGSTLYLASICDLAGRGRVITIDIEHREGRPQHERITYLTGSSLDKQIAAEVGKMTADAEKVMVILDSNHSMKHVEAELEIYSRFVTPGCYLIVEDTNVNGHPVFENHGPGPLEAVEEFLKKNPGFVADREKEKFFLTFNPKGFLKRVK
jgi:cephalosporin hydroxylase